MNIFVTSPNIHQCVQDLDDKRVIKMVLETAQMLSTAVRAKGIDDPVLYKSTHKNHPCTVWAREIRDNFRWLCNYGVALAKEYTHRFGKTHKSLKVIKQAASYYRAFPEGHMTPFADCSGIKNGTDIYANYRACLINKELIDVREPKWTNREKPWWM